MECKIGIEIRFYKLMKFGIKYIFITSKIKFEFKLICNKHQEVGIKYYWIFKKKKSFQQLIPTWLALFNHKANHVSLLVIDWWQKHFMYWFWRVNSRYSSCMEKIHAAFLFIYFYRVEETFKVEKGLKCVI